MHACYVGQRVVPWDITSRVFIVDRYVLLDDSDNLSLSASDEYAYKTTCGERLTTSPNTTAAARQCTSAAGADGIRPQGNAREQW